jgi:hypothetical protein
MPNLMTSENDSDIFPSPSVGSAPLATLSPDNARALFPSPPAPLPQGEGRVVVLRTVIDGEGCKPFSRREKGGHEGRSVAQLRNIR